MKININTYQRQHSGPWGFIARTIVLTLATIIAIRFLPGVRIEGSGIGAAIITAMVIALLDNFIRPILIVLTLPFTIVTMGLFVFIINALIILLAARLVDRFHVDGFGSALLFSLLLTAFNYLLEIPNRITRRPKYKESPQSPDVDADGFTPYEEVKDEE